MDGKKGGWRKRSSPPEEETPKLIAERYGDLFSLYTPERLLDFLGSLKKAACKGPDSIDESADDVPRIYAPLWEQLRYVLPENLEGAIKIYLERKALQ